MRRKHEDFHDGAQDGLTPLEPLDLGRIRDFDELLADRRFSAFLIGPGAGTGEETRLRALAMLKTGRPTLLDADAITAFQEDPPALDRAMDAIRRLSSLGRAARESHDEVVPRDRAGGGGVQARLGE